jgi:O-acetylhomoserine/O-acetylserine sulfhydrylase-like pyridoxal-dependent enzyme
VGALGPAAEHLEDRDEVAWVAYAGLRSSPWYARAQQYLPRGAGSVLAFGIKGGISHGEQAQHIRVSDVTVLEGRVIVLSAAVAMLRHTASSWPPARKRMAS